MVQATRFLQGLSYLFYLASNHLVCAQHERTQHQSQRSAITHNASSTVGTCEARTINYITHTLPQSCLTSSWMSPTSAKDQTSTQTNSNASATHGPNESAAEPVTSTTGSSSIAAATQESSETQAESTASDPAATPFMSFEDWKAMMLQRTGQDPKDLSSRKDNAGKPYDRIPPDMGRFDLGGEDEISLDFEDYVDKHGQYQPSARVPPRDGNNEIQKADEPVVHKGDASLYRSKDAGKTCKERFSYSSFDAGATVLKSGPGAKNAKAILVENKDSYMLLECARQSKYVIVELSDDILIDTIVVANFEFFSSMIRHFRVSVSDRYPVKADRWHDIGTFETRNSRDIQPFLVENPQIFAKYVRIDFLTQYGNEYYCPISLLRVHGSRMLDSWKAGETTREEDLAIDDPIDEALTISHDPTVTNHPIDVVVQPDLEQDQGSVPQPESKQSETSPWTSRPANVFEIGTLTCPKGSEQVDRDATLPLYNGTRPDRSSHSASAQDGVGGKPADANKLPQPVEGELESDAAVQPPKPPLSNHQMRPTGQNNATSINGTMTGEAPVSSSTQASKPSIAAQAVPKQRTGTSSAPAATPTVQEGFFNSITKRLQAVESNLTLSLQYLEDHSRYVQDALKLAEQKQLSKVADFLDNLNRTVFAELRGMRDQYDQIWQSTVIALESQREHSENDIVALSSRLNLLADEVVFQKRMAIVQAVLLLCCLFLVIFSRGVPIPYISPLLEQSNTANYYPTVLPSQSRTMYGVGGEQLVPNPHVNHPMDTQPSHLASEYPTALDAQLDHSMSTAEPVDTQATLSNHNRLSPPLTPSLQATESGLLDPSTAFDLQTSNLRRTSSFQHSHSRKPLPALPEHPSPP
ncbi:unnamed protein product [Clonostachys byssicola]|uniref:SUN domain-containing protein n=1 Tax=Clonostachys byssicola TaxID=160290 RepID=A0A9N9YA58_9HYPO|nr:unnamed protein product [Clonostachys byssicola]